MLMLLIAVHARYCMKGSLICPPLQVTTEIHAHAKIDGPEGATFSVVVYELRWACPHCT